MNFRKYLVVTLTVLMLTQMLLVSAWAMPGEAESGYGSAVNITTDAGQKTYADFTTRPLADGECLHCGVDVSYYQGHPDWDAVYESGVDFAFIRVGYRTYGSNELYEDVYWQQNVEEAIAAGLQVGVYIYSQAATVDEAAEEAYFLIDRVSGYDITLPLVMDFEYACDISGNLIGHLYDANLSCEEATEVCQAFCDTVSAAGYSPAVYASKNLLENELYASAFDTVWLAHYTQETSYAGDYDFWQCSGSGVVEGIKNAVDLDFWYDDGTDYSWKPVTLTGAAVFPFRDVSKYSWSYSSVKYCYEHGIIKGRTATTFDPKAYTTRGQVVAMLYRAAGSPEVSGWCSFEDLTCDYYRNAILWAQQNGIVSGRSDTSFDPDSAITRQDFVTILYRYAGSPEVSGTAILDSYTDSWSINSYARNAMAWAVQNGIMNGTSETALDPWGSATREQIAALIARYETMS